MNLSSSTMPKDDTQSNSPAHVTHSYLGAVCSDRTGSLFVTGHQNGVIRVSRDLKNIPWLYSPLDWHQGLERRTSRTSMRVEGSPRANILLGLIESRPKSALGLRDGKHHLLVEHRNGDSYSHHQDRRCSHRDWLAPPSLRRGYLLKRTEFGHTELGRRPIFQLHPNQGRCLHARWRYACCE